jgi:hypothetical protein
MPKLSAVHSYVIASFLRHIESGNIHANEAGQRALREMRGALVNVYRGVDPDIALGISRKPPGRPSNGFNLILAEYIQELRSAGFKWSVIEIEANNFREQCGYKRVSLPSLRQTHQRYQCTEDAQSRMAARKSRPAKNLEDISQWVWKFRAGIPPKRKK